MTEIEKKCNESKTLTAKLKQEVTTLNTVNVYGECFYGECFYDYTVNVCIFVLLPTDKI